MCDNKIQLRDLPEKNKTDYLINLLLFQLVKQFNWDIAFDLDFEGKEGSWYCYYLCVLLILVSYLFSSRNSIDRITDL